MRRLTLETAREHARAARDARDLRETGVILVFQEGPQIAARELRWLRASYGCSVRTRQVGRLRSIRLKQQRTLRTWFG